MSITQTPDGRWRVDVEPVKGRRFRKTFKAKGEAQRFEATCRSKCIETPNWSPKPKDRRKLSELIERWQLLHGNSLADTYRMNLVLCRMAREMGNPVAVNLSGVTYTEYRGKRLEQGIHRKTINTQFGYLCSMFNVLHELGEIESPLVS